MRQKLFYLAAFILCLSFFSIAKQSGKNCDPNACPYAKKQTVKRSEAVAKKELDLLPFRIFVFSI